MNAAEKIASTVPESLAWAEICERYPDQFVCLVDVDRFHPHGLDVRSARVIAAGPTRAKAFGEASAWQSVYPEIRIDYTGESELPCLLHSRLAEASL